MKTNAVEFEFTDEEIEPEEGSMEFYKRKAYEVLSRSKYSYTVDWYTQYAVSVEMDKHPRVKAGDTRKITLTFDARIRVMETRKLKIKISVPESWSVGPYQKTVAVDYPQNVHGVKGSSSMSFEIFVGDKIEDINRAYATVSSETLPYDIIVPITFIG
jgi:hypothetical protein